MIDLIQTQMFKKHIYIYKFFIYLIKKDLKCKKLKK